MALKMPVIDIPLDDSKFRRFMELFQQYEEQLAKTPGMWQKVDKQFRSTTAAILAQNQALKEGGVTSSSAASVALKSWGGIAGFAGKAASAAVSITKSIAKWGLLLGGGLLGGSLWGLTRMASDMASDRYTYTGLGMRYGSWRSFGINMSRFVEPGSFLSAINQAVSNPAMQGPLYSMGVNPNGTTGQVSIDMLKAMRRLALQTPRGELGMMSDAYGLGPFGGLEALLRLRSFSDSDFNSYLKQQQQDQRDLTLPPGVAKKWQDFTAQMDRAKSSVFKTFVVGLAPLEGPLANLSQSVVNLVERIMGSKGLKDGIDNLATWLDKFNGKISTPKFLTDVDNFMNAMTALAHWAMNLGIQVGAMKKVFTSPWEDTKVAAGFYGDKIAYGYRAGMLGMFRASNMGLAYNNPGDLRFAGQPGAVPMPGGFAMFPNMQAGIQALANQLELYGKRGKNSISSIISTYAPPSENDTAGYIADVAKRMGVSPTKRLDLSDPATLTSLMNAIIRHEQGFTPFNLNARGRGTAVKAVTPDSTIVVTARHSTGASPVQASAALAGTQ